jgi:TetR/AcrR family transcriptional regulator, cholesterol catabolism regulator
MNTPAQQQSEIRCTILSGVHQLFTRFGLKSITMDDIASKLTMSKKTIYQHFKDKDSLVSEYVNGFLSTQKDEINRITKESKDVIEEMVLTADYLKETIGNLNPSVLFDMRKYHPASFKIYLGYKEDYLVDKISTTLREGINQGYFRKDINIAVMAKIRLEQVEMAYNPDIFATEKFNIGDVQIQLFDHFMFGICTLKGHALINKYRQIED